MFDRLALPVTALVNSEMYGAAPGVVEAFRARGDEIAGHGRSNAERQGGLAEADETALIAEATGTIAREEGAAPRGWLGPWISQSGATPDLLAEAGYRYLLDWCHDDQPVRMRTRGGSIVSLPYPQEINDIPQIVARGIEARDFADMIIDAFDTLLGGQRPRPARHGDRASCLHHGSTHIACRTSNAPCGTSRRPAGTASGSPPRPPSSRIGKPASPRAERRPRGRGQPASTTS